MYVHLLLPLRQMRHRPFRGLLSLAAIAVGTALVVAVVALYASLTASVDRVVGLAGRAEIEVSGLADSGFVEELYFDVEGVEGVSEAVPVVRSVVTVGGERTLLVGVDARARALGGDLATTLEDTVERRRSDLDGIFAGSALLERVGSDPGSRVTVAAAGRTTETKILDSVGGGVNSLNGGRVAFAALPVAQELAGKVGSLDAVYVMVAEGADEVAVRERLVDVVGGQAAVGSPQLLADQAAAATEPIRQAMLLSAAMALVMAVFVVFNTWTMNALERRREMATVRAVGGARRTILLAFLVEAAVFGAVGAALGSLVGVVVARALVDRLPQFVFSAVGVAVDYSLPAYAVPLGLLAGVGAAVGGALVPGRRAVTVPPVDAMRPVASLESSGREPLRWWYVVGGGLVFSFGALANAISGVPPAVVVGTLLVGGIAVTFGLAGSLARLAGRMAGLLGRAGSVARAGIERAPRRVWATTAVVALGIAVVTAMSGALGNTDTAMNRVLTPLEDADFYVEPSTGNDVLTPVLLPDEWRARLAAIEGVESVGAGQFTPVSDGDERIVVEGAAGTNSSPALALASDRAARGVLEGRGAIVSTQLAKRWGASQGEEITLATPSGPVSLPVLDVVDSFVSPSGLVAAALDDVQAWYRRPGVSWYEVHLAPGADHGAVEARLRGLVGDAPFPVHVRTGEEHVAAARTAASQVTDTFRAMLWVVAGAAGLAVLNTLLISTSSRRREFGIVRAMGASHRTVVGSVASESLSVTATGALVGLPVGLLLQVTVVNSIRTAARYPVDYAFTAVPVGWALAAAVAVTLLGAGVPMRRMRKVGIVELVGYE